MAAPAPAATLSSTGR
uniref:Uncharacterized protein n=1 Tax=Arundo donax TaxID=35708 RepID=A0A0A9C2S0_ARUDO